MNIQQELIKVANQIKDIKSYLNNKGFDTKSFCSDLFKEFFSELKKEFKNVEIEKEQYIQFICTFDDNKEKSVELVVKEKDFPTDMGVNVHLYDRNSKPILLYNRITYFKGFETIESISKFLIKEMKNKFSFDKKQRDLNG